MKANSIIFLTKLKQRLMNTCGDSKNADYVLKLQEVIDECNHDNDRIVALKELVNDLLEKDRQRIAWRELASDYMEYDYFLYQKEKIEK
jgi:uncharacterized membrane-anchored protein